MESLPHRHLTTLTLAVDYAGVVPIGAIRSGRRGIAPVTGGSFVGERLSGTVRPGSDWFVTAADGSLHIDVRLTLDSHDGATIYCRYEGRMIGKGDAMARFRSGAKLPPEDYALTTVARFECGDERYRWLEDTIAVGVGEQAPGGPIYTLFEVGR